MTSIHFSYYSWLVPFAILKPEEFSGITELIYLTLKLLELKNRFFKLLLKQKFEINDQITVSNLNSRNVNCISNCSSVKIK